MNDIDRQVRLSAIHVRWSADDTAFVARSDQFPGLTYRHECSMAALDGLVGIIQQRLSRPTGGPSPPADRNGPIVGPL